MLVFNRTVRRIATIVALLFLTACAPKPLLPEAEPSTDIDQIEPISEEELAELLDELVMLHNDVRTKGTKCGRRLRTSPPLMWNEKIAAAALSHALDMAENDKLSHTGSDGSNFAERITRVGYTWMAAGENIAYGLQQPQALMELWLNNPVHCTNITNTDFREIGIAYKEGYWVVVFAREKNYISR